ncbi:MAG: ABC-2 family transporter protein [Pseudomonadota bacterium]
MRSLASLLLHGIRLGLATRMADRFDFFASLLVMLGLELLPCLITVLLYGNGLAFPGWQLREVILIQAVFLMAKGIASPLFGGMVWNTSEMIREGTFELLLLKPRHPLLLAVVKSFDPEDLGKLFGGLALSAWCLRGTGVPRPAQLAEFGLLFFVSLVLFGASLLTMASVVMVWVGNARIFELFDRIAELGQYPPVILPKRVRALALAPVPVLAFAVLPASALLGRATDGWLWAALSTFALLALSLTLWNYLLRRFSSAGG